MNALHLSSLQKQEPQRKRSEGLFVVGVVAIAVLMPLAWYLLLYREPLKLLKQISSEALALQEDGIRERRSTLSSLQALETEYATLDRTVVQTILNAIPQEQRLPELIVNISQIVDRSGGELEDFAISEQTSTKAPQGQALHSIAVSLSIADVSYESFKQLVRTLYQNGRAFSVRSLEYTPEGSSVALSLEAYSYSGK